MTVDDKIVVGQLGCGYWGPNLLRNLVANPDCTLKSVAEPSLERRSFIESRFEGVTVEADADVLIQDPEIDALVVATPASSHEELATAALKAGKHVLVEKPLAMTVEGAENLMSLAGASQKVLMVGHTFLYNAAVRRLRDLVAAGELGEIYYVYSQRVNLGQVRQDVNAWWNLAPHDVSILLYLRDGALPSVVSAVGTSAIQPEIEDVVFATLKWADGVLGHVHVSWLDPGKIRRMTVVGSRKMAIYDDIAADKIEVWDKGVDRVPRVGEQMDFDTPGEAELRYRAGERAVPEIDFKEPLMTEVEHFLTCIRGGIEPLTGPKHARDVVAVLTAVDESLRLGRSVELGAS